jgi:hypothetical protein
MIGDARDAIERLPAITGNRRPGLIFVGCQAIKSGGGGGRLWPFSGGP